MKRLILFALLTLFFIPAGAHDTLTVRIKGMRCDECAHKVMTVVRQLPGIESVRSNTEKRITTVVFNPTQTCADSIKARLDATGRYKTSPYSPTEVIRRGMGLHMDDMHCQKCADRITKRLSSIEGVDSLSAHLDKHYFFVRYDANRTCKDSIRTALTEIGYTPVNHYTDPKVAFAYFIIPKEQATQESIDEVLLIGEAIDDVNVNARSGAMAVTYFKEEISADALLEAIRRAGIKAEVPKPHECSEE